MGTKLLGDVLFTPIITSVGYTGSKMSVVTKDNYITKFQLHTKVLGRYHFSFTHMAGHALFISHAPELDQSNLLADPYLY